MAFGTSFLPTSPAIQEFKQSVKAKVPFSQLNKESVYVLDVLQIFIDAAKQQEDKENLQECLQAIIDCPFWGDVDQIKEAFRTITPDECATKIDLWIQSQERWQAVAEAITKKAEQKVAAHQITKEDLQKAQDWSDEVELYGSDKQKKWAWAIQEKNLRYIALALKNGKPLSDQAKWWIENRDNLETI